VTVPVVVSLASGFGMAGAKLSFFRGWTGHGLFRFLAQDEDFTATQRSGINLRAAPDLLARNLDAPIVMPVPVFPERINGV
jgi:hypothetical protein